MEPTDLNLLPPDDAGLEARLRREAAPELPDDGFSLRVVAALPARRALFDRCRWLFCALGAAIGLGVAIHNGDGWPSPAAITADLHSVLAYPWGPGVLAIAVAGLIMAVAGENLGLEL